MSTPNTERSDNSDLPEDVILEILRRLPVKSLLRFKCVCKPWNTIIASGSFVKEHYEHNSNEEDLLLVSLSQAYSWNVHSFCQEPAHLQLPYTLRSVTGAVNGIFVVAVGSNLSTLALWNPATKEFRPLPQQPDHMIFEHLRFQVNIIGFGLDPLSGDFKVVSIWELWDNYARGVSHHLVFVYNSGSVSWRNVASFKSTTCIVDTVSTKTYCNGVHYWIYCDISTIAGILAFDMRSEKFEEIEVPDCVQSKLGCLTTHDDSIALVTSSLGKIFEVWVMKNKGSWNRVAVVSPLQHIIGVPICLWKNNELLFNTKNAVFTLYNICTRKIRRLKSNTSLLTCVVSYKESLVSIKGGGDRSLC